ncbi:hypothetical protein [Actinomadura sp. HBU206391]|uniref:hypothetical protein n=1 Tax=Actinomadura sp. HBU206391 TaxID=2731692 RepID=UPI00164F49BA|nr:hypothetical protein [Actinomadura sp. HBU206391]MBC6462457.1 hypothetical protein [Actinomadura sp. HBU206391]
MPPGGPGMPPRPPYGPPPSGGSNTGLIIGLAVGAAVLIVAVLVAVIVVTDAGDPDPSPTSGPATPTSGPVAGSELKPTEYDDAASWSLWDPLNDRTSDSAPLSTAEVFGSSDSRSVEDSRKNLYTFQGEGRLDSDCTQAIWGEGLKTALQGYNCTQVVRGVYADSSKRIAGHVAVFNLRDVTSANQFIKDLDPALGKGFVTPLPGQPAPLDRFGSGFTGADAGAYGHLVVVSWVGYTDGKNDSSADIDAIAPRSAVQRAAKNFLFTRVSRAR